jgi:hypothetical protein
MRWLSLVTGIDEARYWAHADAKENQIVSATDITLAA